ncbi:carboxypeptidase M32 [Paenibacillus assamensis]|uniref:carboxypeptidase M32 n=1 Tax=Paenibacillus assamensis TaxID=311244 RepID=UPI00048CAEF8|nr:carboxypeptidase M32 [Paenibacillus assamensis]
MEMTTLSTVEQQFLDIISKMKAYSEAVSLMHWDLRTGAPRKGAELRSEAIGKISSEVFKLSVSEEMGACLDQLEAQFDSLDAPMKKMVKDARREYNRSKLIPPKLYEEYVVLTSKAETVWEEAKNKGDFELFKPYLQNIITMTQQFIDYWGVKDTRYDTLLDMYEPNLTTAQLDSIFGQLKDQLVPLVHEVQQSSNKPNANFLQEAYDIEIQKDFSSYLLGEIGYDFEAGRLDESAHPFMIGLNTQDIRITTKYLENDVTSAVFSSLHEGGHALYEQNISSDLARTSLATGTSMGIHESQSRLWENIVGRSREFWKRYYGELQRRYPEQLGNVDVEQFYCAINRVEPSLIRIEADEVTYNLHIIIRYELEKMLINDNLSVDELPEAWNSKYESYLGIRPSHDGEGVLQDVHWSFGGLGYFPSYSLGNMYGAQMMNTLRQEMPDVDAKIEAGDLLPIKEWFTEHVYQYGSLLTPAEIIEKMTGEPLNPQYLVDYLTAKTKDIYKL